MRLFAAPVAPWWARRIASVEVPAAALENYIEVGGKYTIGELVLIEPPLCVFRKSRNRVATEDIRVLAATSDPRLPFRTGLKNSRRIDHAWVKAGNKKRHSNLSDSPAHPWLTADKKLQIEKIIRMAIDEKKEIDREQKKVLRRNAAKV